MRLPANPIRNLITILGASIFVLAAGGRGEALAAKDPVVVSDVAVDGDDEAIEVRIDTTAPSKFTYFELDKPRRLVVDFLDIHSAIDFKEKTVGQAGVERLRTSFFTDKTRQATRIVFDLKDAVPYRIADDGDGHVRVAFGTRKLVAPEAVAAAPEPPVALAAAAPAVELAPLPVLVTLPAPAPASVVPPAMVSALEPAGAIDFSNFFKSDFSSAQPPMIAQIAVLRETLSPVLALKPAAAPPAMTALLPPAPAAPVTEAVLAAPVAPAPPVVLTASTAAPNAPVNTAVSAAVSLTPSVPRAGASQAQQALVSPYTGEIISLDLEDVELKSFFHLISDISGLNVVLDPNVGGKVTLVLKDVPWDQALDVVLKNYSLGSQLQGNILRIATVSTLDKEDATRKAAKDALDATAELDMHTYHLNYTKSDLVKATLQKFLTARGEIVEDSRKNTVFVKDVPSQFERIDKMVKYLDTPAQQVVIEARLLVANKSFSRDIGNQLGFLFGGKSGNVLTGGVGQAGPIAIANGPPRTVGAGTGLPLAVNFPAAATSGLAFLMQPGGDILLDEIITLAEARGTAKTISRPKITTQNNKPASIQQGTQIPVQTNVNNTVSVQFISFALKLTVTPQITEANTILLDVSVENSQPDFAKAVNGIPSVSTQQAATQVLMPDGGTAAIGGILIDTDSLNISQVPGLASIPVVGMLFKGTKTIKTTGELLFFVTARIQPPDTVEQSK